MVRIRTKLNSSDLKDTIAKLKTLQKNLEKLEQELPKEIAERTSNKISDFYNQKGFVSAEAPKIGVEKTDKGYSAYISGKNVVYEEFGTGDVGFAKRHPLKDRYNLRDYNSGRTIRSTDNLTKDFKVEHNIKDGLYWTYYEGSQKVYTQGIAPGLFMYNTDTWLKDNYKEIIKEKVDDVLSKL